MQEPEQLSDLDSSWGVRELAGEACRTALQRLPRIYVELAKRRNPHRPLLDRSTDLVLEGFPRSGNTYLLSWLSLSNPDLRVASHLHSISHVRAALRQDVPVIIALRPPQDALASEYLNRVGRNGPMSLPHLLYRYKHFYTQATRYASHVVMSPFKATIDHPEAVLNALRDQSGMDLNVSLGLSENDVLADVERLNTIHAGDANELTVARPSEARADLVHRIKRRLAQRHASELARLQELHDTLAASPSAVRWTDATPSDSKTQDS